MTKVMPLTSSIDNAGIGAHEAPRHSARLTEAALGASVTQLPAMDAGRPMVILTHEHSRWR
jgi:hypothetical protein